MTDFPPPPSGDAEQPPNPDAMPFTAPAPQASPDLPSVPAPPAPPGQPLAPPTAPGTPPPAPTSPGTGSPGTGSPATTPPVVTSPVTGPTGDALDDVLRGLETDQNAGGELALIPSPVVENGSFSPPADASIAGAGLTKRYGLLNAVNDVDFYVPRGSVYGLIGPNGAGKSTLMSMIASLLLPTGGRLVVEGHDPITEPAEVRRKIGYMPDGLGVYEGMNVAEYIEFFAAAYRIDRDLWTGLTDSLLELVELEVKRTAQVNSLSRGMKQRLSLARALVHDPQLLILDEPASGLDPRARIELRRLIENLNAMGKTVLVSSHILTELQEVCTHVGIMEAGRLLASGSPADILEQTRIRHRVLAVFEDGTTQEFDLEDGMSRADLLRKLVLEDPREVVEYRDVSQGLEDVFLSVTEGIVQ